MGEDSHPYCYNKNQESQQTTGTFSICEMAQMGIPKNTSNSTLLYVAYPEVDVTNV